MTRRGYRDMVARWIIAPDDVRFGNLRGQGDPSAISVDGERGKGAVLAFHGFAGTPNEVRAVTEVAARLGLFARAPALAGHGPHARDLMNAGWDEWVSAASAELVELAERAGSRVVVCGLSLGALIATHLAATRPDHVAGLIALANATRLCLPSPGLPLLVCELFQPFGNRFYFPKTGADIRDPTARGAHMTYDVNPVRSAVQVLRAGRIVRAELGKVQCPTLVLHGRLDRVCPVANAYRFAKALGTTDVEVAIMPSSGHIVSVDVDRQEVAAHIEAFLRRIDPSIEAATARSC